MSRLTITLEDGLHQSLKETAIRQGRTIRDIIEESLKLRGIRSIESAQDLLKRARSNSTLNDDEAMSLALDEASRVRNK